MFLKNNNIYIFFIFFIILFSRLATSEEKKINDLISYLNLLNNLSVSFIQDDTESISEGKISIGDKRVRIDYETPSKILIVLSEKKGMYYNYDLDEDEFFNTKKTSAWFFYEIFKNPNFFLDSNLLFSNNNIIIQKKDLFEDQVYSLKLFFEDKPLVLRKIELKYQDYSINLSFFNYDYNRDFRENYFKLINPNFF